MILRPFRNGDQQTVRSLVLAGLGDHFGQIDETKNPDLDDIHATYVLPGHHVVVAEIDDAIVGAGTLLEERPGIGRLVRMTVASSRRGGGIGRQLVAHLLDEARRRGYRRVLVETTENWQDAIGLYRACGFLTEGFRDGDIHMFLELEPPGVVIREERPPDGDAIRSVHQHAFGADGEGRLVDELRAAGLVLASVVAVEGDTVVGHALYSALPIETEAIVIPAAALAPVGVLPDGQRNGIGSALIRHGLRLCRERACAAVIVLGYPGYYRRFGFAADTARGLQAPYAGPAFMALEFESGLLARGGVVRYSPPFQRLD